MSMAKTWASSQEQECRGICTGSTAGGSSGSGLIVTHRPLRGMSRRTPPSGRRLHGVGRKRRAQKVLAQTFEAATVAGEPDFEAEDGDVVQWHEFPDLTRLPDTVEELHDRFHRRQGSKIGGAPTYEAAGANPPRSPIGADMVFALHLSEQWLGSGVALLAWVCPNWSGATARLDGS